MDVQTGADLSLNDYLGVIKRRGKLLCAVVAAVVLIGVLVAYRVPPM
jgi:uncharacterized protein involved in exopolysaccharide biosynthesis